MPKPGKTQSGKLGILMAVAIAKEDYQRKAAVLDNAIPGVPLDDSPQDKSIKDKKRKPTYNFSRGARLINY